MAVIQKCPLFGELTVCRTMQYFATTIMYHRMPDITKFYKSAFIEILVCPVQCLCWFHSGLLFGLSELPPASSKLVLQPFAPCLPSVAMQLAYLGGRLESPSCPVVWYSLGPAQDPGCTLLFCPVYGGSWWCHQDLLFLSWQIGLHSLVTSLCVPPGEKRSGERSRISWAYYPKAVRTNEIARSVIIT